MNKSKSRLQYLFSLTVSVLLALVLGGLIMAATGHNPIEGYGALLSGALGTSPGHRQYPGQVRYPVPHGPGHGGGGPGGHLQRGWRGTAVPGGHCLGLCGGAAHGGYALDRPAPVLPGGHCAGGVTPGFPRC